uniref:Sestrin n=1 Tax=Spongospora subterranea TaxID=70186 RepID=A0A0H5RIX0_9EUKA|eukprot:CRZ08644.1 hypothetical protein [Spongospora subterranea]
MVQLFGFSDAQFLPEILSQSEHERRVCVNRVCMHLKSLASRRSSSPELSQAIPTIQRLAIDCPFPEIRAKFATLCEDIGVVPRKSPISYFLPSESILNIADIPDGPLLHYFQDSFLLLGRLRHVDRVISMLPGFAVSYFNSYVALMHEEGPLPIHFRNYLAIMAAARHGCSYLVQCQESEFLINGGPIEWLTDPNAVPEKIHKLRLLNAYMSHQPWRIHPDMLPSDISIPELVHAIVVMSTFQALSGLCFGFGICLENSDVPTPSNSIVEDTPTGADSPSLATILQTSLEDLLIQQQFSPPPDSDVDTVPEAATNADFSHYVGDVALHLQYEDYNVKTDKPFYICDFDFKGQAYSLLARYWHENGAQLLEQEFDLIYQITDRSVLGSVGEVDTGPIRRAIWHYIFRLFGAENDAYNYQEVNIYLSRAIKLYIKKMSCHGHTVTSQNFQGIRNKLRPNEIAHVALLTMEARRQATILFSLRALRSKYHNA